MAMRRSHPVLRCLKRIGHDRQWLATASGVSAGHLSDILNGRKVASVAIAKAISAALDGEVKPATIAFHVVAEPSPVRRLRVPRRAA